MTVSMLAVKRDRSKHVGIIDMEETRITFMLSF